MILDSATSAATTTAGSVPSPVPSPSPGPVPASGPVAVPEVPDYNSPFRSWDARASVRSTERRQLRDGDAARPYFSPDLVPLARHKYIQDLRPDLYDEVLIQHLYRYLDFTMKLEHLVVNRTALGIAHGTVGVALPEDMQFDAYKVYCDEAYHALFSMDLLRQVRRQTGIEPRLPQVPYFMRRLQEMQEAAGPENRSLTELLFVIVSETLISGSLMELPQDADVVPAVREVLRDHALDEGRHHTYFAIFLKYLWGQLSRSERRTAALMVPQLIHAFLRPDVDAMRGELKGYGFAEDAARQVVAEVLPESLIQESARTSATQTVRLFSTLGALELPEVVAEFEDQGFI
ncbi:diiron oxygenase [Streptomyces sp. NBC_01142]|uniref:diiron oxygenase n=1 Tax=Streptomyces sp. NBC_01142 TaxID=2975865 RepID=UPI00224DC120|nr:diiron oxygenase [Streptomyces sp. NBC_01142]MCX4823170.1 diiron oxygenase [Streptomyces sp. NBC_01142]